MSEYQNYIGKYISKQRTSMGMPLREMAKILDIAPAKLNDIELGNCLPELELLQLMEKRIGIKMDSCVEFLLNWETKKQRRISLNKKVPSRVQVCYVKNQNDNIM